MIKKIRQTNSETDIIILSAHTDTEYFLEAVKLNLTNYLIKPIKSDDIKNIIFELKKNIQKKSYVVLTEGFKWNKELNVLFYYENKIELTNYETLLIQRLLKTPNQTVSYIDLHYYISRKRL